MNVELFHKTTYTLNSVQSRTFYQSRDLHELKVKNSNIDSNETCYVSKLIPRKNTRKEDNQQPNHDEKITSNLGLLQRNIRKKDEAKF